MGVETGAKIIYNANVENYLDALAYKLFHKEYFGFLKTAKDYVDNLTFEIERTISIKQHKLAPPRFKKFGTHYINIKTTKRTTWYVFFIKNDNKYIIRYITNNHVSAHHIRGLK